MNSLSNRREFLRTAAVSSAGLALSKSLLAADSKKSVLVFTKSSGFEHAVVKRNNGKPSIMDDAVTELGNQHGFTVGVTKDGRIFDSKEFHQYAALVFFTTGDLTTLGTDGKPPMSAKGKEALLEAIHKGMGFVGVHAASDTFHTPPDTPDLANRYIAHGEGQDPYLKMLGAEFIIHGRDPRLQDGNLIINDPKFPGLEGATSPVTINEEWYSLKDFTPDLHVILTLDTQGMKGECYQRAPYPVMWARMHGKGRVFFTAMGDRPENWKNEFFLNTLGGGIRWSIGAANANVDNNLKTAAPGYSEIPPKFPPAPEKK